MNYFLIYAIATAGLTLFILFQNSDEITDCLIEDIMFLTGIGERAAAFIVYLAAIALGWLIFPLMLYYEITERIR